MLTHYFSCLESPQLWSLSPRAWTDSSGFHNYQIIAVTNSQQNTHHLDLRPNTEDWSSFQSSVSSLPLASQASLVAACSSTLTRSLSLPRFWSTWYYQHTVFFYHDKINLIIVIKFRSSTRTRRRCTRSPAPSPPSWRIPWPPPPGSRQEEGIDDYDEDDDEGVEDTDESNIILIIKIRTLIFAPVLALSHAIRFYSHSLADIKGCGQSLNIWIIKVSICKISSTKCNL